MAELLVVNVATDAGHLVLPGCGTANDQRGAIGVRAGVVRVLDLDPVWHDGHGAGFQVYQPQPEAALVQGDGRKVVVYVQHAPVFTPPASRHPFHEVTGGHVHRNEFQRFDKVSGDDGNCDQRFLASVVVIDEGCVGEEGAPPLADCAETTELSGRDILEDLSHDVRREHQHTVVVFGLRHRARA